MPTLLPPNPLKTIYGKPALALALDKFDSLPVKEPESIVSWIATAATGLTDLREPTIRVPLFETHVLSLLTLAKGMENPKRFAPDWEDKELEDIAALLVAASVVRRARAGTATPGSSTDDGEVAAKDRGWKVVEDAITALKEHESELVELGAAVLSGQPELLQAWLDDQDDGSFADAAADVRRRLDIVEQHKDKFNKTAVDQALLDRCEALHRDAWAFYRGREGRNTVKTQMTLARDQAFSLLLERLERLRLVLRAAYRGNAEVRAKIDGAYWRKLERLSMPRRKRKEQPPVTG